ncbi:uncharacterized protein I303_103386 [Kwoniella dejecticola CBS 10117]|uniref:Uncharacterized protein n=1 Tax=Kwoniella dejecticola CBS 10117 TaxID=1296121 RepID=A0A1A6A6L9_9TREE|nr:uncharacterized protein I303_03409 [Kwoniella dejecticola CBS 10117]OBR85698.1 hypothetical protein I303_03409 [Kwoniella dejecticola CBS 10117]
MKSLIKSITTRSNSTSDNNSPNPLATAERSSSGAPILPPISSGVSILPISHHTPSIPIPNLRRSSEPISAERWARPNIPSYAVSRTATSSNTRSNDLSSAPLPNYQDAIASSSSPTSQGQSYEDRRLLNAAARDYFGVSPTDRTGPIAEDSAENGTSIEEDEDDDDGDGYGDGQNSTEEGEGLNIDIGAENDGDDDDDPLIPRRRILDPQTARRNTFSVPSASYPRPDTSALSTSLGQAATSLTEGYIDLPIPSFEPPIYSPSLGRDELRLISAIHLSADHPASAYFNAIAQSPPPPAGPLPSLANGAGSPTDVSTGNKKLRLTITRGGRRMNVNGTGPLYIKAGREDWIEGRIDVGKVDRAVVLEIAIIGMVNVSYYVRGQYTVLDTLPLARNKLQLFPPSEDTSTTAQGEQITTQSENPDLQSSDPLSSSTSNLISPTPASGTEQAYTKDGHPIVPQNTSYSFSLQMPNTHYKDTNSELPPSCDLQQVGMQANVEYVLRAKLVRRGLRFNETLSVPIIYEPRSYIPPRRIRALTIDDPFNPGWRTVELNGGKPKTKSSLPNPAGTSGPGIDVTLLLPSPPILLIPSTGELPSFPFHLHFHSTLPHVLSTYSNPEESKFVVRLTRVTIFRLGLEKEIRRIEIPTKCEVWQEGGDHIALGLEGIVNEMNRRDLAGTNATQENRRDSTVDSERPGGLSSSVPNNSQLGTSADSSGGGPLRRFMSAGSSEVAGVVAGSSSSPRRKSFLGDRRGSFSLRRKSTSTPTSTSATPAPASASTSTITGDQAITQSGNTAIPVPPTIAEDESGNNGNSDDNRTQSPIQIQNQIQVPQATQASRPIVPVDMTSTDVHLKGNITIKPFNSSSHSGNDLIRRLLIQSFVVPEMTLTYVLEVGIEPKKGSVKENFTHVWGGGVVEVVLGRRGQ